MDTLGIALARNRLAKSVNYITGDTAVYSVRLPREVIVALRTIAAQEGSRPSALVKGKILELLDEHVTGASQ